MRAGLGLLGLLITAAIVFYLMYGGAGGGSVGSAVRTQQTVVPRVQALSGKDAQGNRVSDATKLTIVESGGKVRGVKVESVDPASALAKAYDLKGGDVIIRFGPLELQDVAIGNEADAKTQLDMAFAGQQSLTVKRGDATVMLEASSRGGVPGLNLPR